MVQCHRATIFFYFLALLTLSIRMFIIPFIYSTKIALLGIRYKVTAIVVATS